MDENRVLDFFLYEWEGCEYLDCLEECCEMYCAQFELAFDAFKQTDTGKYLIAQEKQRKEAYHGDN